MTFMTGYQSMDGVPSTANRWLLTDVLKNEWGFRGVLVTGLGQRRPARLRAEGRRDLRGRAIMALRAGNDIMMTTPQFYEGALEAVRAAASRVGDRRTRSPVPGPQVPHGPLRESRRPDLARAAVEIARPEHRAVNLAAARQSLVLLQNKGLLPSIRRR